MPFDGISKQPPWTLLHAAGLLLQRDGWCQNRWKAGSSRCLQQAIMDIYGVDSTVELSVYNSVLVAAAQVTGTSFSSIPNFNDAFGRTREQVLQVIGQACRNLGMPAGADAGTSPEAQAVLAEHRQPVFTRVRAMAGAAGILVLITMSWFVKFA